jgi:hypothetical protein
MASSEKMHILVYPLFLLAVISLGVSYRPANREPPRGSQCWRRRQREQLIDYGRTELLIMRANSKGR